MLRWSHDWGTKVEHFEMLLGLGRRVPEGFYERPEILPIATFYWTAFCALETERAIGMAAGPIPRSAAKDYAIDYGIDDLEGFENFWQIITRLDSEASKIRRVSTDDEDEKLRDKVSIKDTAGVKNMMRNMGKNRGRPKPHG